MRILGGNTRRRRNVAASSPGETAELARREIEAARQRFLETCRVGIRADVTQTRSAWTDAIIEEVQAQAEAERADAIDAARDDGQKAAEHARIMATREHEPAASTSMLEVTQGAQAAPAGIGERDRAPSSGADTSAKYERDLSLAVRRMLAAGVTPRRERAQLRIGRVAAGMAGALLLATAGLAYWGVASLPDLAHLRSVATRAVVGPELADPSAASDFLAVAVPDPAAAGAGEPTSSVDAALPPPRQPDVRP